MGELSFKQYVDFKNKLFFLADIVISQPMSDVSTHYFRDGNTNGLRFDIGINEEDILTLYTFESTNRSCSFEYEYRGIQYTYTHTQEVDKSVKLDKVLSRLYTLLHYYVSYVVVQFSDRDSKDTFVHRYSVYHKTHKKIKSRVKVVNTSNLVSFYTVSLSGTYAYKHNRAFINKLFEDNVILDSDVKNKDELNTYLEGSN